MKQVITVCKFSSYRYSMTLIGDKCITLIGDDGVNILLYAVAFTVQDEVVFAAIVR